jgi:trehalose-6-phosphate synthase
VPSRTDVDDYKNLKDELEREIGRISGRFATSEWTPIKYIYKNISQCELTGFYRDAAIALITPVRDGMNLVAKEYVACQIDDPGVLIISPFTGAGETMNEALLVNPLETGANLIFFFALLFLQNKFIFLLSKSIKNDHAFLSSRVIFDFLMVRKC